MVENWKANLKIDEKLAINRIYAVSFRKHGALFLGNLYDIAEKQKIVSEDGSSSSVRLEIRVKLEQLNLGFLTKFKLDEFCFFLYETGMLEIVRGTPKSSPSVILRPMLILYLMDSLIDNINERVQKIDTFGILGSKAPPRTEP